MREPTPLRGDRRDNAANHGGRPAKRIRIDIEARDPVGTANAAGGRPPALQKAPASSEQRTLSAGGVDNPETSPAPFEPRTQRESGNEGRCRRGAVIRTITLAHLAGQLSRDSGSITERHATDKRTKARPKNGPTTMPTTTG